MRDEFWNRVLILRDCHVAIHDQGDTVRRRRTEERAVTRLLATLGRTELAVVVASIPQGATDPSATIEAYASMRRQQGRAA